jgi:membrane-associated phospholipid phosphatase
MPLTGQARVSPDTTFNFGLKQFVLSAGALSVVVLAADAPIARDLHGAASPGALNVAHQFDHFGDATGIVPIVGGIALVGLITHQHVVTETALHAAEAVVLASLTTQAGKHIMGRERPYDDPDLDGLDFLHFPGSPAFPSGHTTAAFALATTLGDAVGTPWARVGFYALATGTGLARMTEEEHWLSDVMAGAAIGFVSARFVSGRYRIFGVRAPRLIIGPTTAGVRWTF